MAQLEWRGVLEFAKDPIGIQEVNDGLDTHTDNQIRFNLPTRLIAKTFLYRYIFKGTAWAYANDPDFMPTSKKQDFWQDVIDRADEKYIGITEIHKRWEYQVRKTGELESEVTGRIYKFKKYERKGELDYSINDIVNYPIQGFGGDLVALVRVTITKRLKELGLWKTKVFPILTVHDSVIYDVVNDLAVIKLLAETVKDVIDNIQDTWQERYGVRLTVKHDCEIKIGHNWKYLKTIYKDQKWFPENLKLQ